ncbi:MAG: hypothetical protein M5U19_06025 [Microthrixaceae bacterium]|nr:hypothetical protein [Microthrixaceae bacterium]
MLSTTKNVLDATVKQALDLAKAANSAFRAHDDVAVSLPGGMFGHVHKGRLVGFGLEPVGDVVVDSERRVEDLLDGDGGHFLWGQGRGDRRRRRRGCVHRRRCDRGDPARPARLGRCGLSLVRLRIGPTGAVPALGDPALAWVDG